MNTTKEENIERKKEDRFNDLMHTTINAIAKHWRDTVTLTALLNNDPKSVFF